MSTNTLKQALEIVYGDIKNINKRVKNLESASIGVIYNETTKSAVAYQDNVSANACPYALMNILGGMSYKSENVANITEINYRLATNGTLTQSDNGNTTDFIEVKEGETYSTNIVAYTTSNYLSIAYYDSDKAFVSGMLANQNVSTITIPSGIAYMRASYRPSLQDNLMINKGSTLLPYQPYFEGIRDTATTSVISKDSNNTALQTINIPNEIQALEGYGWGINDTCYNYIDFVNKKFIQKSHKRVVVDANDFSWTSPNFDRCTIRTISPYQAPKINYSKIWVGNENISAISYEASGGIYITFTNAYESREALIQATVGVIIYYELATPIETDISSLLPADFNSIQIEPNGTITFENEYQQAIPYEYLYLEKVGANNE